MVLLDEYILKVKARIPEIGKSVTLQEKELVMLRFLILLLIVGALETHNLYFCGKVPTEECDIMKNPPVSVNYSKVICALSLARVLFIKIRVYSISRGRTTNAWRRLMHRRDMQILRPPLSDLQIPGRFLS